MDYIERKGGEVVSSFRLFLKYTQFSILSLCLLPFSVCQQDLYFSSSTVDVVHGEEELNRSKTAKMRNVSYLSLAFLIGRSFLLMCVPESLFELKLELLKLRKVPTLPIASPPFCLLPLPLQLSIRFTRFDSLEDVTKTSRVRSQSREPSFTGWTISSHQQQ